MNRSRIIALGLILMAGLCLAADENVDQLVKEFKGQAESVKRTPEQLQAAYARVLDSLLPDMGSDDVNKQKTPQQTFQDICWRAGRPGAEDERAAVCRAIVPKLGPETPQPARIWLLTQLEHIGRAEAVARLAELLNDNDALIRSRALRALQSNPAPEASAALRTALQNARDNETRVAYINTLGFRRDPDSVQPLIEQAKDNDDNVRSAAMAALARIGDKAAVDVVAAGLDKGSKSAQAVAADSYLLLADALCAKGDKATALEMYRKMAPKQDQLKCAAIIGLAKAGGMAELPALMEALADQDVKIQGAAIAALEGMADDALNGTLAEKVNGASPEVKVRLLRILAERGAKDRLAVFLEAAKDADEGVRIAAYKGMGLLADPAASEVLVTALVKTKDKEREAAAAALDYIPGDGVIDAIIKGLKETDADGRIELMKTLAMRRSEKVVPALLATAKDEDPKVRAEAFKFLGDLADAKALPTLVDLLMQEKDSRAQKEAEKAVVAACKRVGSVDPVLAGLAQLDAPVRCSLLRVLGKTGGEKALEKVLTAGKDENAEIKDAAIRALCDWPDASAATALLDLAKNSQEEKYRVLALRAYVRVAGLPSERPVAETLKMFADGMAAAQRPDDRKMVLAGLATMTDPAALDPVRPYLKDDALRAEAAMAMIKIAEAISLAHRPEAEAALREVAEACKDAGIEKQVKEAFGRVEQYDDFITAWQISKAFTEKRKREKELFDKEFAPETADAKPKDCGWRVIIGGKDRSKAWMADLDEVHKGSHCVAYLRSWVRSDKAQKARLETGSDDGLKVWLNGKVILEKNVNRGVKPGSDKTEVDLKEGWNTALLKVTQGGGDWSACCRVRAADGAPLPGIALVGDPKALDAVAADLGNDQHKDQAVEILFAMIDAYTGTYPEETNAALKKAMEVAKDKTVRKKIGDMVSKAAMHEDYITAWRVAGPYTQEGKSGSELFDVAFPPETADHKGTEWKPMAKDLDPKNPWCMMLETALGGENRVAYLITYVHSPKKQGARLEMGSDDGIKAWLNGKVVHANNTGRPVAAGSDTANVTLEEGWNSLLLKITQGGGHWAACARLRDPNGLALGGLKVQAETPPGVKFIPAQQTEAPKPAETKQAEQPKPKAKPEDKTPKPPPIPTAEDIKNITEALPAKATANPKKPRKMLVFSVTNGFHHNSIPWGQECLRIMGQKTGAFEVVVSDDLSNFEPENIKQFDAICFNNTTRELFLPKDVDKLPAAEQEAAKARDARLKQSLFDFVKNGGGLVGIHAATDSFYQWPEFGEMMGAYFDGHPWHEDVGVKIDDPEHPVNAAFKGKDFIVKDEIYQFKAPYSREKLRVLLSLDITKTNMNKGEKIHRTDGDFAVSWIKAHGAGRVFYCSLGHRNEIFWNPAIVQHYLDGIQFALGDLEADATPKGKQQK
ncbi:MAG: HEAT repeat domain-containing protein [Planctomycetota bacterium]